MKRQNAILILIVACHLSLSAQQAADRLLTGFEERFAAMDSLLFPTSPDTSKLLPYKDSQGGFLSPHIPEQGSPTRSLSPLLSPLKTLTEAQISAAKSRTGLEISSQVYYRPGNKIGYDADDPLAAYNLKAAAELQWHIFQSSLYKRATKIRTLRIQGDMAQLDAEKQAIAQTLIDQKLASRRQRDAQLLTILQHHSDNLALLTNTQMYLLQNGSISSDDLLKLLSEKAEIDRQLTTIRSDSIVPSQDKSLSSLLIPELCSPTRSLSPLSSEGILLEPDTALLMNHIRMTHHDLAKLDLQSELLDCRRRSIDYLQTMNISPFARYAWYHRPGVNNSVNIDLGVTLRIPLSTETAKQRKALRAEQDVVKYQHDVMQQQIEREVRLILIELKSYNENIKGEYARLQHLKEYMSMRNNSYANGVGEYNRLSRLLEYNACLASWERLITFQYQRDEKLIDLQSYVFDRPLSDFIITAYP